MNVSLEGLNIDLLKDKFVWIRVLSGALSLFCLFLLVSFSECATLNMVCKSGSSANQPICMTFPFSMSSESVTDSCDGNAAINIFHMDYNSQTILLCLINLGTLVICLLAVFFYMNYWDLYHAEPKYSYRDFLMACVLTASWLAGASAFMSALSSLKQYASDAQLASSLLQMPTCSDPDLGSCAVTRNGWGSFGSLNLVAFLTLVQIGLSGITAVWILRKADQVKSTGRSLFENLPGADENMPISSNSKPGNEFSSYQ